MVKVKVDMTGWKMWEHGIPDSKLTVIQQAEDYIDVNGRHLAQWLCECNCEEHNKIVVLGTALTHKSKPTRSCGCLHKERVTQVCKKYNQYDLSGKFGIGWTSNTNEEFYFDLEDYDLIKDYCWSESVDSRGYHSLIARDPETHKRVKLCWILGYKGCDHINRNPLDNRKNNLRPANTTENAMNRSINSKNTSGVIGVSWHKRDEVWSAYINLNKKRISLGSFVNKNEAIQARLRGEIKYFGEFAPQKHLYEEYGITQQND